MIPVEKGLSSTPVGLILEYFTWFSNLHFGELLSQTVRFKTVGEKYGQVVVLILQYNEMIKEL